MSDTIGEVNINLRMSLAQFKKDTQDGADAANKAARQLGDSMGAGTDRARESIRLLSEDIGVHLPRGLQTAIASIPAIGTALNAAFSSVAVLAVIEVIAKVIEKLAALKAQAAEVQAAMAKAGADGEAALRKLDEEVLKLQSQFDELTGQHMKAFHEQLQLIDMQTLDNIRSQFEALAKSTDDAIKKMQVGNIYSFLGMGNNQAVQNTLEDIQKIQDKVAQLASAGKNADIGAVIQDQIDRVKSFSGERDNEQNYAVRQQAEAAELRLLETMKQEYDTEDKRAELQKQILQTTQQQTIAKQAEADAKSVTTLRDQVMQLYSTLRQKAETPFETIQRQEETLEQKIRQLAADNPEMFRKAFPADSVDTLIASMQKFAEQAESKELLTSLQQINQELLKMGKVTMPDLGINANMPTLAPDASIRTSSEQTLEKIKTDQKAAADEARKVVDGIETQNQKLEDQQAILEELRRQGLLTGEEYEKAMKKAQDAADGTSKAWGKFGTSVGEDITQAMLFGKSWSDAIKTIIVQMIALIAQMTILKAMKKDMDDEDSSSGGGGFFSGLTSGIFGGFRAEGGPLEPGQWYIAGEHGPEPVWGGGAGAFATGYGNGSGGGNASVVYNIDARGAEIGVEERIKAALKQTEDRAVTRAIVAQSELRKRR